MSATVVRPGCVLCERPLLFEGTTLAGCEGGCDPSAIRSAFGYPRRAPGSGFNGHNPATEASTQTETLRLGEALDDVVGFVRRFVAMTEAQAVVVGLWVAHTHVIDAAEATPFLAVTSAEKRSGKTRLLDVLELLVRTPWRVINPSEAVMFRKIERDQPTLLLDETDAIFKSAGERTEPLRSLLNAGNRRGTTVPRCIGANRDQLHDFNVFCPRALAGIGRLPDTVADRSIPIRLKRRAPSEQVERFRRRRAQPEAEVIRSALGLLAEAHVHVLTDAEPALPHALDDRAWDAVEPLLAVADLAEGDWPLQAREALVSVYGAREVDDESTGLRLLADIRAIFAARQSDRLPTELLLDTLHETEEAPWADWYGKPLSARTLAKLLKAYRISSHSDGANRGYKREAFEDAWTRYLHSEASIRQEPALQSEKPEISFRQEEVVADTLQSAANPHGDWELDALTDGTRTVGTETP